ncbi:putative fatty-acid--CoA ligase [Nocardia nova SH22a]|uniref:Putative fatty-acid--CoA ligase n=1 Tax=Nocardia nova SH22a TaxID=1415166 RepID=W5TG47_9NOCA|nr:long-chain fatty acid--CoA ligase [Nocardia nova]AHH18325.1 putative fatty-acid--CoA ligase [Nocardia nova SH22a]
MREFGIPAEYRVSPGSSLGDLVHRNAERYPDVAVIARKTNGRWQGLTATEFLADVRAVAKGLIAKGIRPGDRVAIMSRTRYEWTLLDFAIWSVAAVTVPVYDSSSAEQVEWILGDSGAVAVITETDHHTDVVIDVRDRLPELAHCWQIDTARTGTDATTMLEQAGARISGATLDDYRSQATADTLATIVYTSGTTGRPKGCQLTHGNFLAELSNIVARLPSLFHTGESSVLLFLPLAHVLGRIAEVAAALAPIEIGHVGDITDVTAELAAFRPTLILGVPRVFEKVYNAAATRAQLGGRGQIFVLAADTAVAYSHALDRGRIPLLLRLRHALFDRLVYRKLRAALGGRATHAISGGAALGEHLGHFYRGIGFTVLEGYGLTETCAAATFNPDDKPKIGTVGVPLPGSQVRIADDGEILLRGPNVFTGYWNNPAATAAAFRSGWFATGDLGALDDDGYLTVIGRKKELIVTAGGKNVAPAVIEDRIRAHAIIGEVIVIGDGKPFISCLVTIDADHFPTWKQLHGKPADATIADLGSDPDLLAAIQAAVDDGNRAVSRAEAVKKFRLLQAEFTEANGYVTPSLKLKRNIVLRDFATEIDALYTR